jgi:hypothetical protein
MVTQQGSETAQVPGRPRFHDLNLTPLTLIGHPYASIGMGEQLRSHGTAMSAVHLSFGMYDIFRYAARDDPDFEAQVAPAEVYDLDEGIRIFHINGDEVTNVIAKLREAGQSFESGYNIIVPAWELPTYPTVWAEQLKKFDEVWALSTFIQNSLAKSNVASFFIGQSGEIRHEAFLPRKYFGIRESSFVFLNFFDLSSYASRKNPEAVLEVYRIVRERLPSADIQLVLKVKDGGKSAADWVQPIREAHPELVTIERPLTGFETRSLINACDCFVSMHRAEGFGRGLAEAMSLGRLTLGTGWSGNVDFMTPENSLLVDYTLRPLKPGEYPHADGQEWAEPDVRHAARLVEQVLRSETQGREIAARGKRDIDLSCSFRSVGVRTLNRLQEICSNVTGA